jgi:hypothetical protein
VGEEKKSAVRRLPWLPVLVLAVLAAAGGGGRAAASVGVATGPCGLPDAVPLWIDYAAGSVSFRNDVFGRPGVIVATSGTLVPQELRRRGAQTVYWENSLGSLVGTTIKPADPAGVVEAANRLVDRAIAATACETPVIGLNELNGPGTTTPWTVNNAGYRANVLALLRQVAARGARAMLLLPAAPYTGGEALEWWRQAAQVADLVPEVYFQAPAIMRLGPVLGSRRMRQAYRTAIANFTEIGVPVSRLGLVLGFQSGPGTGGREGLQPTSAWLEFAKLQTLAAKQVATELSIGTVWQWGWGTFNTAGADPDKPKAACVALWARDQALCDGPGSAGVEFDTSLETGQIATLDGVHCRLDGGSMASAAVAGVTAVTQDREIALTALFERMVESEQVGIPPARILEAERTIVSSRFGGSRAGYVAALRDRGVTLATARGIIGDELRRAELAGRLTVPTPSSTEVRAFYAAFPALRVRLVRAQPAPAWLGGRTEGFALVPPAPDGLFALRAGTTTSMPSALGVLSVVAVEEPLPLAAVPLSLAGPSIQAALRSFSRVQALDDRTVALQERALGRLLCTRDELPSVGSVDLAAYLPFLSLGL